MVKFGQKSKVNPLVFWLKMRHFENVQIWSKSKGNPLVFWLKMRHFEIVPI